jgi:hypothetical protein
MGLEIKLKWVQDDMPRLKDIDVARLCGLKRDHEDSQTNENKKRKSG